MSTVIAGGLVLVTGLLALLVVGLLRSHAEIVRALHDLGVNLDADSQGGSTRFAVTPPTAAARADGSAVHDITGERPGGGSIVVAVTGTRHRTLLAFLTSTCTTCRDFWDAFGDPATTIPGRARLVVVVRDTDAESPSALGRLVAPYFVTVHSTAAWQQYGVPGAPYFVLVDGAAERVIGEGTAPTWRNARGLLEQALGDAMQRPDGDREAVVDAALRDAGIEPGDPSLYPGTGR